MSRLALLAATATCALSLALVSAACGGETIVEDTLVLDASTTTDSSSTPPTEASTPADTGSKADAGRECAAGLTNTASAVTSTAGEGGAPVFTAGGTVADGTYELSELTIYAPIAIPPQTAKATAKKTGDKFEMILSVGQDEQKGEFTLATSGANFELTATCGDAAFEPSGTYEVVGGDGGATTLRVASAQQGFTIVFGFTKK